MPVLLPRFHAETQPVRSFPAFWLRLSTVGPKPFPRFTKASPSWFLSVIQQRSQFDIDRWLIGITQVDLPVKFVELPTIAGMVPSLIGDLIDSGMRSGIPSELWGGVMTVYDDAELVQQFTGTENGLPSRVMLLDPDGRVLYFHDRGFSPLEASGQETCTLFHLNSIHASLG